MVKFLKTAEEFAELMEESKTKLVIIDFTATWCPPCRMIGPIFERLATEHPEAVFVKVDVDEASDIAQNCGVSAMPTFQYFKDGVKVDELVGASEGQLVEKINALK
eukprot:397446_1